MDKIKKITKETCIDASKKIIDTCVMHKKFANIFDQKNNINDLIKKIWIK